MMTNYKIEQAYNNISYTIKEDVGFPHSFIYLTTEQETFIIKLLENQNLDTKHMLLECIDEMKELLDEI